MANSLCRQLSRHSSYVITEQDVFCTSITIYVLSRNQGYMHGCFHTHMSQQTFTLSIVFDGIFYIINPTGVLQHQKQSKIKRRQNSEACTHTRRDRALSPTHSVDCVLRLCHSWIESHHTPIHIKLTQLELSAGSRSSVRGMLHNSEK